MVLNNILQKFNNNFKTFDFTDKIKDKQINEPINTGNDIDEANNKLEIAQLEFELQTAQDEIKLLNAVSDQNSQINQEALKIARQKLKKAMQKLNIVEQKYNKTTQELNDIETKNKKTLQKAYTYHSKQEYYNASEVEQQQHVLDKYIFVNYILFILYYIVAFVLIYVLFYADKPPYVFGKISISILILLFPLWSPFAFRVVTSIYLFIVVFFRNLFA